MRPLKIALFMMLFFSVSIVFAQDNSCPIVVAQALAVTEFACDDLGRNVACYGNTLVEAVPQDSATTISFDAPGDTTDITILDSMALSPMNLAEEVWGVAVMSIQANLPDTNPGQNVVFLMFGDVSIQNDGDAMESFYFQTGIGDAPCAEAPDSGILIQTPEGAREITLTANNVEIQFGSTVYITAEPDGFMTVALLDGQALVTAGGKTQVLEPGFFTIIEMDANLKASGQPNTPQAIPENVSSVLPIAYLPSTVTSTDIASTDISAPVEQVQVSDSVCEEGEIAHLIQSGENLFRISLRYGVSQAAIAQRNGITNTARIYAGVTLCIPTGASDSGISSQGQASASSTTTETEETTTDAEDTMIVVDDGDNWCNEGEPWGGQCYIPESVALTNYLWRCGWYFAHGLSSYECGAPPADGDTFPIDDTILSASDADIDVTGTEGVSTLTATIATLDSSITFYTNTSRCVVDIAYSGTELPSRWSLSQEFAAAVLSLEDAGCSGFTAYFNSTVVLRGSL